MPGECARVQHTTIIGANGGYNAHFLTGNQASHEPPQNTSLVLPAEAKGGAPSRANAARALEVSDHVKEQDCRKHEDVECGEVALLGV